MLMKWKKIIFVVLILIVILGLIGLEVSYLYFHKPTILIKKDEVQLGIYHQNLQTIKENLNLIALPSEDGISDWVVLKKKEEEDNYSFIVHCIKIYYMMGTGAGINRVGDGFSYSNSQFLDKLNEKEAVSEKEWKSLMDIYKRFLEETLNPFIYYESSLPYPFEKDLEEACQKIANYNQNINEKNFQTYEEVLENEVKESELMKDVSNVLVRILS